MNPNQNRIRRMELLGGIGAGVVGAGIALLFAQWLEPFAIPALLVGIAAHGWAMFRKGRLERQDNLVQPAWAAITEGLCWVMLALLVLYAGMAVVG